MKWIIVLLCLCAGSALAEAPTDVAAEIKALREEITLLKKRITTLQDDSYKRYQQLATLESNQIILLSVITSKGSGHSAGNKNLQSQIDQIKFDQQVRDQQKFVEDGMNRARSKP